MTALARGSAGALLAGVLAAAPAARAAPHRALDAPDRADPAPGPRAPGALPMELPRAARAASVGATWLVGARPGPAAAAVARRFGAERVGVADGGGYAVARERARAFAAALRARRLLVYAEPDVPVEPLAVPDDPLSGPPNDWRAHVADPAIDPPPLTPQSPLIALVDAAADTSHPEWTGDPNFTALPGTPVTNLHGTATAAVAAAPSNGIGILGVWPGARALNVPLRTAPGAEGQISCRSSANAIARAIQAGAAVINMSYGATSECATEKIAIYDAVSKGIIPVAAAGNEFERGNPLEFPASLPHVLTVAATDLKDRSASFSNANDAIDLSAPGVGILTAVPPALEDDDVKDGYERLSGTSFAAPMVSAAVAWVRAARGDLQPDQVAQAVRRAARDVGRQGWDSLTGFGVLDVKAALTAPAAKLPIHDPSEPNDNLVWVDGRAYGTPSPPVWAGGAPGRTNALLDREEDPADVYRVVVPPRSRATVSAIPRFGDVDLGVYGSSAISLQDTGRRLAFSRRPGKHVTERVKIVNDGSRAHSYYVAVRPQGRSLYQDRAYTLRVG